MPMNPLPPAAGPAGPAAPTGAGRKAEPGSVDSAFTAMLAALVGAQLPMVQPSQTPETVTDAPAGETAAALPALLPTAATPAPADPKPGAAAVPITESIEALLQAQRVTPAPTSEPQVTAPAVAGQAPAVAPLLPKAGQWLVEPLAADAVAPDANSSGKPPLPALADILTRAAFRTPAESGGQALKAKSDRQQPDRQGAEELTTAIPFTVAQSAAARTEVVAEGAKAPAPIPSPIDPDRLMDAIAKSAVSSGDGHYTVTLRLHPEQLGEVHLQLHVAGREVQTTLQVSTPAAQQALQSKGDQLRQSLDQNGLTLSGFHVNTGQGERRREQGQEFTEELANRPRRKTTNVATPRLTRRQTTLRRISGFDTLA